MQKHKFCAAGSGKTFAITGGAQCWEVGCFAQASRTFLKGVPIMRIAIDWGVCRPGIVWPFKPCATSRLKTCQKRLRKDRMYFYAHKFGMTPWSMMCKRQPWGMFYCSRSVLYKGSSSRALACLPTKLLESFTFCELQSWAMLVVHMYDEPAVGAHTPTSRKLGLLDSRPGLLRTPRLEPTRTASAFWLGVYLCISTKAIVVAMRDAQYLCRQNHLVSAGSTTTVCVVRLDFRF